MCVTGNKYVDLALVVAVVAVTAGTAAPFVAPAYATAFTIGTGAALGATTSAALGNDPLMGALIGGATAGAFGGVDPGLTGSSLELATAGQVAIGGAGALAMDIVMPKPPDYTGLTQASQVVAEQQKYNSQNIATSGSGGRQAAGSLAQAIKRSKQRKLTQGDVSDLSIDTGSFAPTGLQFA